MFFLYKNDPAYRYEGLALATFDKDNRGGIADADFYRSEIGPKLSIPGRVAIREIIDKLKTRFPHLKEDFSRLDAKLDKANSTDDINDIVDDAIRICEPLL
jgi:hypothetical protein